MKFHGSIIGAAILFFLSTVSAATVNGRFIVTNTDSSKISILIQINTNSGTNAMGGATIVLGYDTTVTGFTTDPVKDTDYFFHNFCGNNYSVGTVTKPMTGRIWVNIDLPFNNSNNGTFVSDTSGWTDVATIYLDVIDSAASASFFWIAESPFWGIYDQDNLTLWNNGDFENQINFPVPVELSSFTASLIENNFVHLRWTTFTSVNNQGFEIEKSQKSNVKSQDEWEKIGFVESMGNSNTLAEYSFTDETPHSSPVVKYRLKMIDFDGTFNYSDIVEVHTGPLNFELAQNYPNPFNPSTKIVVRLPHTTEMKLVVYNILGEAIKELANAEFSAGTHEFTFDASGLASGIYIYRVESADYNETKKMVLLR
ncbi:MAG: T9SS type A sorting domain-containing protein [Ignavibacteriaceae bacterium]